MPFTMELLLEPREEEKAREMSDNSQLELIRETVSRPSYKQTVNVNAGQLLAEIEREYLPRPRFEDGAVVNVGDVVLWSGCKVKRVEDVHVEVRLEGACGTYNSVLKRPNDTLERIEDDVNKLSGDYWGCTGIPCSVCPAKKDGKTPRERYGTGSCPQAMTIDLLRRQREVLERGR